MDFAEFLKKFKTFLAGDRLRAGVITTTDDSVLEDSLHVGFRSVVSRLGNEALDSEAKVLAKNDHLLNRAVMIAALFWFENNTFFTSPYFKPDSEVGTEKRFWGNVFPAVQEQIDHLLQLSGLRNTQCFVL